MSAIDALLKGKTTKTAIPKSKKSTSAIDALLSGKKTTETIPQNVRTVGFPEHLGGGQYKVSDIPGELVLSPRSQSALSSKGTIERDHIIPVALAGTSADENLQYIPTTEAGRQAGKMAIEQDAIAKYQKGEININEARLLVQTKQQELKGLTPTKEEQTAEGQLKKRFGALGNVIGKVGGAIEGVVDTIKKPFEKKDGMRFEVAEGLSGVDKAQAQNVINYEIAKGQEEKAKLPLPTKIKQAVAGQARKGMPDYQAYTAKEKEPIIEERKKAIEAEREYEKTLTPLQRIQKTDPYLIRKAKIASEVLGREVKPENIETEIISKAEKDLIEAIGVERTTEKVAKVATAPVRFLAGYPAAAIVSYALEKADSDLSLDPNKMPEGKDKDLMKLLTGDTEVKRLMKSEDLYGIIGRAAGMPVALAVMAILENPFIAGTGLKTIIKDAIKKEGAEMVSKIGPKEYLKQVIKYTDDAIKKEFMAGNISKDVAEQALKEVGLPAKLAKDLEPERVLAEGSEIEPINSVNPTGKIFTEYTPNQRAIAELGENITTLDKTANKKPDELITIYRGAPKNQKEIVAGDFITTNKQLAKDYAGDGIVLEKRVKAKDILDDITEPLGEEYIYKPTTKMVLPVQTKKPKSSEIEPLIQEAKKYKSAEEFVKSKPIDKDLKIIYNELYGKEKDTNKFIVPEGLSGGQGLPKNARTGEIRSLPKNIGRHISGLTEYINKNPDGFTINLKGKPATSGYVVSPYKGKEVVLNKVDEKSLEFFLLNNYDLLKQEGNNLGGWLNKQNGKFYLDISRVVDNVDDAIGYAAYNDQIAIFDIKNSKEINTKNFLEDKLRDVWNKAKGETKKSALPKPKKQPIKYIPEEKLPEKINISKEKGKVIDINKYKGESFSTHYEKIKREFGFSDEGIEINKKTTKEMDRKAFDYIQSNPQKAMRVAYRMEKAPLGQNLTAIQRSLMVILKDVGKKAQAEELGRLLSKELTEAGQSLNVAKLDIGPRNIIKNITDKRLEKIGMSLGDKPEQALELARKKIKTDTKKAGRVVVTETTERLQKTTLKEIDDFINKLIC